MTKTSKTQKKTPAKPKAPAKPAKSAVAKSGSSAAKGASKKTSSKKVAAGKDTTKKDVSKKDVSPKGTAKKDARKDAGDVKISKKKAAEKAAATTAPTPGKSGTKAAGKGGGTVKKTTENLTEKPTTKTTKAKGGAPKRGVGKDAAESATLPANGTAPSAKAPPAPSDEAGADKKKVGPKGITIVQSKPSKPSKPKPKFQLPQGEPLLKPGAKWKPLIPSGPSAPPRQDMAGGGAGDGTPIKTKLSKKELERYRQVLLAKRGELVGDVRNMESEALMQDSGSLSHTPQHMAEQGTDVFDQSLSLDLAAVDRTLIREIDAALERIDAGTYGICEFTGKPISTERLDELPWTRYSIEAARERERRSYQP